MLGRADRWAIAGEAVQLDQDGAGTAQIGVALSSEIAGVPGVSGVPLLPGDPTGTTQWLATLSGRAEAPEAARAFIASLLSPDAMATRRATGLVAE